MRLEIERMKEEEANRAKEEMRKRMLKNRYAEEERYSKINRLKILNQWRKLMRLVKVEDLRKDIEIISQNHEREVQPHPGKNRLAAPPVCDSILGPAWQGSPARLWSLLTGFVWCIGCCLGGREHTAPGQQHFSTEVVRVTLRCTGGP